MGTNFRIEYDRTGITVYNFFGKPKQYTLQDVQKIELKSDGYIVWTAKGKIRVEQQVFIGADAFLCYLRGLSEGGTGMKLTSARKDYGIYGFMVVVFLAGTIAFFVRYGTSEIWYTLLMVAFLLVSLYFFHLYAAVSGDVGR